MPLLCRIRIACGELPFVVPLVATGNPKPIGKIPWIDVSEVLLDVRIA